MITSARKRLAVALWSLSGRVAWLARHVEPPPPPVSEAIMAFLARAIEQSRQQRRPPAFVAKYLEDQPSLPGLNHQHTYGERSDGA